MQDPTPIAAESEARSSSDSGGALLVASAPTEVACNICNMHADGPGHQHEPVWVPQLMKEGSGILHNLTGSEKVPWQPQPSSNNTLGATGMPPLSYVPCLCVYL